MQQLVNSPHPREVLSRPQQIGQDFPRGVLGTLLRKLRHFQPQLLANVANLLRIEVMMRSSQRQLRNPALAMDRQMSVSLAAMMSLGVKMAPALGEPFAKCVDLHEMSPICSRRL